MEKDVVQHYNYCTRERRCLGCGKEERNFCELNLPNRVYCQSLCQIKFHRVLPQLLYLAGGKGKDPYSDLVIDIDDFSQLPDEVFDYMINLMFPYETDDEAYDTLFTKRNISPRFNRTIKNIVLRIGRLPPKFERNIKPHELLEFRFIRQFTPSKYIGDYQIIWLAQLRHLDISNNERLTDLALRYSPHITHLRLANNKMITNDGFNALTNLEELDLASNKNITGDVLLKLPRLVSLNLSNNFVIDDKILAKLSSLRVLALNWNNLITNLSVTSLTNLTHLKLNSNRRITDEALLNLSKLTVLSLDSNNRITDAALNALPQLTSLDLVDNGIITDHGLVGLTNLTKLDLSFRDGHDITPGGIKYLINLRILNIYNNKFPTKEQLLTEVPRLEEIKIIDSIENF